jgi:hypothetical protein
MIFDRKKDIKRLEENLENKIIQERETLVNLFTSARSSLIADNTITIARGIEEAKKEMGENIDLKVKNAVYEKTKEYEISMKKMTEDYLNTLKEHADSYFGAVLTQYQLIVDDAKNTSQEFKSLAEKSRQHFQGLENQIEELRKVSKIEEIEKILNYKKEIDLKFEEIKAFYETKDKKYMEIADSLKKTKETIEKDYNAAYERFAKEIEELNKLIAERKAV